MAMNVNIPAQDFTVMLAADDAARRGRSDVVRCLAGATTVSIQTGKRFRRSWDVATTVVLSEQRPN